MGVAEFEKVETTDCVFCSWEKPKTEEKREPISEHLLCPMRKLTKTYATQREERFLPCLKEECAWWVGGSSHATAKCAIKALSRLFLAGEGVNSEWTV